MFCFHNDLLPPLFLNLFMTNHQIHINITQAQPVIGECFLVVLTSGNSQFFAKEQKSGIVFLYVLQTCQAFLSLKTLARVFIKNSFGIILLSHFR